jgi:hypothetical protein
VGCSSHLPAIIALVLDGDELLITRAMRLRPQFFPLLPDPTE